MWCCACCILSRAEHAMAGPWRVDTLPLLATAYVAYLLAGAAVFQVLELPAEQNIRQRLTDSWAAFIQNHSCVDDGTLDLFLQEVLDARSHGVRVAAGQASSPSNWDFSSALLFTVTVVTTIGYGSTAPGSTWGRASCAFYALLGIPLNLQLLSRGAPTVAAPTRAARRWLRLRGVRQSCWCGVAACWVQRCSACFCPWPCCLSRRDGAMPRASTTPSSRSAPSALETWSWVRSHHKPWHFARLITLAMYGP
uniref:Potassium channel subfamily K member 16-like isoform X3 n=1 Tax=Petromyzon marinus TaxID=7757 RepID=A0AAJ7SS79_PETMA|nr:potassium channel subfamily K member 16-like isoform X3 [Petromyzon marinus]